MHSVFVSFLACLLGAALGYCCAQLIWQIVDHALRRKREKEWAAKFNDLIEQARKRGESHD